MIIGVCGTFASGKDTVAKYIASKGFDHVSTGDLIREYISENDLGVQDRDNWVRVGNLLRKEKGSGYLVQEALRKHADNVVISGIRSTGEAEALLEAGGLLIAVDAPIDQRYEWASARKRDGDAVSREYFIRQETVETTNKGEHEQRINDVMALAQELVANEGSLDELHAKIDAILAEHKEQS